MRGHQFYEKRWCNVDKRFTGMGSVLKLGQPVGVLEESGRLPLNVHESAWTLVRHCRSLVNCRVWQCVFIIMSVQASLWRVFGWESTIMADLLGFHIIPHVSWRVTIGYTSKEAMERIRRHARHTVPGILNGEHVVYRETRLHEGDRLTISISIQCHAATCTSEKT